MKLLTDYFKLQKEIFEYFGYQQDWRVIPLDDCRNYYWKLNQDEGGGGTVCFADTEEELESESGNYYENEIYTQRFLPKWVYRGQEYTMVCVDTHSDGNQYLSIFCNEKEKK